MSGGKKKKILQTCFAPFEVLSRFLIFFFLTSSMDTVLFSNFTEAFVQGVLRPPPLHGAPRFPSVNAAANRVFRVFRGSYNPNSARRRVWPNDGHLLIVLTILILEICLATVSIRILCGIEFCVEVVEV